MPGDADETDKPFLARFDSGFQSSTFPQRRLPIDDVGQIVQLQQVDVIDAQPIE